MGCLSFKNWEQLSPISFHTFNNRMLQSCSFLSSKSGRSLFCRLGSFASRWPSPTPVPISRDRHHGVQKNVFSNFSCYDRNALVMFENDFPCLGKLSSYAFRSQSYATLSKSAERVSSKHSTGVSSQNLQKRSQATLMYLIALVMAMVGCSYAAVPLYRKFCQATGYGGTVRRRETVEEKIARHVQDDSEATRHLAVQFNADVADGLPWKFTPTQREVKVKPGQSTLAFYTAENLSSKPITGVSTYNVTPMKAGLYFNKIQCFCFEEQRLLPGEKIDMPVFFYIDPEFAKDPKMENVKSLILSYTFFKVEDSEEESSNATKE